MPAYITRGALLDRWETTCEVMSSREDMGRPDPDTYVDNLGYPLEVIKQIEAEDKALKFPEVNNRNLVESISALAVFRAQIGSRAVFLGHISSATVLTRGFGLVLWEINRLIRYNIRNKVETPWSTPQKLNQKL